MKKTQKKTKLTKTQIELIFNEFYDNIQNKVLDLVFDPKEEEVKLIQEMMGFVSQQIINDVKFPATDEKIIENIRKVMVKDGKDMAQDLIYNQVKSTIKIPPPTKCDKKKCGGCKCSGDNDFNKKRGLG